MQSRVSLIPRPCGLGMRLVKGYIPYSWKYWQSLNLVVCPQTDKFGSGVSSPFIKERCRLPLEALEESHELLQEIKLAAC